MLFKRKHMCRRNVAYAQSFVKILALFLSFLWQITYIGWKYLVKGEGGKLWSNLITMTSTASFSKTQLILIKFWIFNIRNN